MFLSELRHSHSYLLEVFLEFVCVDAHRYRRVGVSKYLADCRNRHVLTQEIATSVVPQVMPRKVRQASFLQQRSQHPPLEVLVGIKVARIGTED
jgi:hypothetical protein